MSNKQGKTLNSILLRQFDHSWELLSQVITNIDDDKWFQIQFQNKDTFWVYSLTIYHILETTDFYNRTSPEGMKWGAKGQIDWDSSLPLDEKIKYLTKSFLRVYLNEIKENLTQVFNSLTYQQIVGTDNFSWFSSILDKYLYLLRHNMMHIGELNKTLRDYQQPRLQWE